MYERELYFMSTFEYDIEEIDNISIGSNSVGSGESDFEIIDVNRVCYQFLSFLLILKNKINFFFFRRMHPVWMATNESKVEKKPKLKMNHFKSCNQLYKIRKQQMSLLLIQKHFYR